jgi:hypothetical protein
MDALLWGEMALAEHLLLGVVFAHQPYFLLWVIQVEFCGKNEDTAEES